jgi:hypothetical protein
MITGVGLLAAAIMAYFFGSDPIADLLNQKWHPINADQQRQKAIETSATALKSFDGASIAAALDRKSIAAFAEPLLKPQGVEAIRIKGDQQLLYVEADFRRVFSAEDIPLDFAARDLLLKLKPDIRGTISMWLGISGTTADDALELRLLPAVNAIHIDKVIIAEKFDGTLVGDALALLLNRYAGYLTAMLNEAPILHVTLPSTLPSYEGHSGAIAVSVPGVPDAKVNVSAKPIINDFRISGIAPLIDDDHLAVAVQLISIRELQKAIPVTDVPSAPKAISSTFADLKADFMQHLKKDLDISVLGDGIWLSLSKEFLAEAVTDSFAQAEPCFSIQGTVPKQSLEQKVRLPDETEIDCKPEKNCDLHVDQRDCRQPRNCPHSHDERNCSGLDKIPCEIAKGAQNKIYDANYNACVALGPIMDAKCEAEKAGQNELYKAAKLKCEGEKSGLKLACETARETVKNISRTGNFANLDVSMGGPANFKVCFKNLNVSPDLKKISANLDVDGRADIAAYLKFVPLDIAGHLACPAEWTADHTIIATLPPQALPVNVTLSSTVIDSKQLYVGHVNEVTVKLHFEPSPTVLLLRNANFTLACLPLAGLINSVTLNLAPFIPDLLKDFDYTNKPMDFSFAPKLPELDVLNSHLETSVTDNPNSITLVGKAHPAAASH